MADLKSVCEIKCPNGCEPFEGEAVTLVNADNDDRLKGQALNGEINLFMCPECNELFYHDEPLIYIETAPQYLVFILPKSYEDKKDYWVSKMLDDFDAVKQGLFKELKIDWPPTVVFGIENFQAMLENDELISIETEVIECVAKEQGFKTARLKPYFAREKSFPYAVAYCGTEPSKENIKKASAVIYSENDRLKLLKNTLGALEKEPSLVLNILCS